MSGLRLRRRDVRVGAGRLRRRQMQAWRKRVMGDRLVVAINVSPIQFRRDDIEREVANALTSCGLPPSAVELELTESLLVADTQHLSEVLQRMGAQGIKFAIDDFGTGYSNLGYLQHFPIHLLKIDQSFIRKLVDSPNESGIVRAVIEMAHCLKLEVVAEGVEDADTLQRLIDNGCKFGLGVPDQRGSAAGRIRFLGEPDYRVMLTDRRAHRAPGIVGPAPAVHDHHVVVGAFAPDLQRHRRRHRVTVMRDDLVAWRLVDIVAEFLGFVPHAGCLRMIRRIAAGGPVAVSRPRVHVAGAALAVVCLEVGHVRRRDNGEWERLNLLASMAKCFGSDMAMKVATDAVQVFGGDSMPSRYRG